MSDVALAGGAGLQGARIPFEEIPVIDVAGLVRRDPAAEVAAALAIGDACRDIGFFYVTDHGIPQPLIDAVFAEAARFFALPLDRKLAIHIRDSPNHRGYFPLQEELTDPALDGDLKEGFDMALELPADDPDVLAGKSLHGPNNWPADLPGFRDTLTQYYDVMVGLGRTLCRAYAISLDLSPDFFVDKLSQPVAQLRLLRYPPQTGPVTPRQLGAAAHSDYGCVTMLAQDTVGGLQVRNGAGQWIEAPPMPGTFVCNIGDMMGRWTNDRFSATRHRVINRSGRERYSVPFFFDPNFDVEVRCLDSCHGPDDPPRYPPIKCGDYLVSRFNDTFAYRRGETG